MGHGSRRGRVLRLLGTLGPDGASSLLNQRRGMRGGAGLLGQDMTPDDSRRVSVLLGMLFGLAGMGSSSAAIALPLLGDDLGVGVGDATWTISLYVLMLAVTTAVYGRVSDLVGVRIPLLVGIGLMTAGALVAAFAPTFEVLLVGRLFQGAGAAAVPTLGVAVLSKRYDGQVRGVALGRLAGIAAALSCLGPLVGGVVEHAFGWRAVMSLPILGVLVLPFLWRALSPEGSGASLDVLGAVLVAGTAAGLVLLVQSPSTGILIAALGAGLIVLGAPAVAWWVRRRPHGFLPLSVIRDGRVVRSSLAASAVPAAWFAHLVAVPAVLVHEGWAAWQVGLLLVPSAALAMVMPRTSGRLLAGIGPAASLGLAGAVAAFALLLAAVGCWLVEPAVLAVAVSLVTVSFGLGQPALIAAVGEAVELEVRGVALGVATLLFLVGGSVGSAVVGGLGEVVGIPESLAVLAALPLLGLLVLVPELRRVPEPA
jgi:MFS family permease